MGGSAGLRLGEDSVGVGLIGGREVGGGVGRWLGLAWAGDVEAGRGVCRRLGAWVGLGFSRHVAVAGLVQISNGSVEEERRVWRKKGDGEAVRKERRRKENEGKNKN